MRKKLRTYHPKGYIRIVFSDNSQILTKLMNYQKENYSQFSNYYEMWTDKAGTFAHWTKAKDTVQIFLPITRIYYR
jgi:hypothetical protein